MCSSDLFPSHDSVKREDGLTMVGGNDSRIIGSTPTLASLEGGGARIVIIDEAGKIKGLMELVLLQCYQLSVL